jgi:hypothetical protein
MARELYSLLTNIPFRLPTNPGAAAIYVRARVTGQPVDNTPLSRMEQASIDTLFNHRKHYFLSMQLVFLPLGAAVNKIKSATLTLPSARGRPRVHLHPTFPRNHCSTNTQSHTKLQSSSLSLTSTMAGPAGPCARSNPRSFIKSKSIC